MFFGFDVVLGNRCPPSGVCTLFSVDIGFHEHLIAMSYCFGVVKTRVINCDWSFVSPAALT